MKTALFLGCIVLSTMVFFTQNNCYATCCSSVNNDNDKKEIVMEDTARIIYYLDGVRVPYSIIMEKGPKGELARGIGYTDSKNAIRAYGEKFRYGVMFYESREEENDQ